MSIPRIKTFSHNTIRQEGSLPMTTRRYAMTSLILCLSAPMKALSKTSSLMTRKIKGTMATGNWTNLRNLLITKILKKSHWMSCLEPTQSQIEESPNTTTKIIIISEGQKIENKRYRKILMTMINTRMTVWTKIKKRKMMSNI